MRFPKVPRVKITVDEVMATDGADTFCKKRCVTEGHREADLKLAPRQDKIKPLPVQVAERFIFQMQANV